MDNDKKENLTQETRQGPKWDLSIVIALIAVLISTVTAYINFEESKIMVEQQKILSNQQEASVWPFLENRGYNNFSGDSMVVFKYIVKNKGIGPAIIDNVTYKFNDKEFKQHQFYEVLNDRYSDKVTIQQLQNSSLDKIVLAPGESHTVITEKLIRKSDTIDIGPLISEINDLYKLEYCYCSVYGKCWFVRSWDKIEPSEECEFRKDIR